MLLQGHLGRIKEVLTRDEAIPLCAANERTAQRQVSYEIIYIYTLWLTTFNDQEQIGCPHYGPVWAWLPGILLQVLHICFWAGCFRRTDCFFDWEIYPDDANNSLISWVRRSYASVL